MKSLDRVTSKLYGLLALALLVVLLLMPFAFIWSLNTLFGLSIAYTWKTYLAGAIIGAPFIYNYRGK